MRGRPDRAPPRWLRIVLPAALILVWVVVGGIGGPTFGKLDTVSSNDQAAFLPASAESTEVRAWQRRFVESDSVPAIIVWEAEGEVTSADVVWFAAIAGPLEAIDGVAAPSGGASTSIVGPIPSDDGRAVEMIVPLAGDDLGAAVAGIRDLVADAALPGYTGYVTGPAGLTADLINAFSGIDGILLLVALGAVFTILLLVYRSLMLPVAVLMTAVLALTGAIVVVFVLASWGWVQLSGQSQGILSILVIGAATDYSLLLVARFREALVLLESGWAAMGHAIRGSLGPIVASGGTVIVALLCLLVSGLSSNRSLGPIAAIGILFAMAAALTLLPALLVLLGRAAFWPFSPRRDPAAETPVGQVAPLAGVGRLWTRIAEAVRERPRATWVAAVILLGVFVLGLPQLRASGVAQTDVLLAQSDAVDGQAVLGAHFDAGSGSPVLIVADADRIDDVMVAALNTEGVTRVRVSTDSPGAAGEEGGALVVDNRVLLSATLRYQPDSAEAEAVVEQLRAELPATDPAVLVGGATAIALDTNLTAQADLRKIIPIVLAVILVILVALLRSILAPVLLVLSVVLSYASALGVAAIVFNAVGFPGADATVPLFGFVFLVALGIDYNIFLMTRVREESLAIGTGAGILRGLGMTGGVITSAGVVLAATFAALGVIPILFLAQLAFIVAFGVLLETVIVRSLLVPALALDIGRAI